MTVHVLKYGRSLCRMDGLPRDWPEGHRWVSFEDEELAGEVTCEECLKQRLDTVDGGRPVYKVP